MKFMILTMTKMMKNNVVVIVAAVNKSGVQFVMSGHGLVAKTTAHVSVLKRRIVMNEMRKLMEAVIKESDAASLNPQEFAAFEYGVDWGNSAQYGDGGYERKELPRAYQDWVDQGRPQPDSYEWDESLDEAYQRPADDVAYIAAKLYLTAGSNGLSTSKPALARKLSELAGVDAPTAQLMMDAIDAHEDLREAPDEWELTEGMSDSRSRAEKVDMGSYENGLKLIYGWVKSDTINLREFAELIQVNRDSIN